VRTGECQGMVNVAALNGFVTGVHIAGHAGPGRAVLTASSHIQANTQSIITQTHS
jgi:hypothetical protein